MAAPPLKIKRGTTSVASPVTVPNTVAGEPIVRYNTDQGKYAGITEFYIGDDGATSSKLIADSGATSAANEILTAFTVETADGNADGVDASLTLTSQDITGSAITVQPPSDLAADYTLTLPPNDGDASQVLQTNGAGVLTWVDQTSGFSGFSITDGTNTESIASTDAITFTGGTGITATVSATDTLTIAIDGTVVTTGDTGTVTSTMIADATIVNGDISGTAAIDFSKLAALTGGNILVGNGSNVATSVAASGDVSISNTGAFSVNSVQANSVNLTTDTVGNYVAAVTTAADSGLVGGNAANEGTTSALALKNAAGLTDTALLLWDDGNGQLANSSITETGGTVTIAANLTVTGTTTTVSTTNTAVSDRIIELANGTSGTVAATADSGLIVERGDASNVFVGFDEGEDVFVAGTTAATGATGGDTAPTPIAFLALQYNVTDAAGTNEAVISYLAGNVDYTGQPAGRYLSNVTIDCGEY